MKHYGVIVSLLLVSMAHAQFVTVHKQGWSWYNDMAMSRGNKGTDNKRSYSATAAMQRLKMRAKEALNKALLEPTTIHVKAYIELQNQISQRASQFSKAWRRVLLYSPQLDYSVRHPTNRIGRQVSQKNIADDKLLSVKKLASRYGLFYFFRSTCPYCQRFSPVLKNFSKRFNFKVIPISLDGKSISGYPNPRKNQGQAERLGVKVVPSVFAVDALKKSVFPVASGLVTQDILLKNLLDAIAREKRREQ